MLDNAYETKSAPKNGEAVVSTVARSLPLTGSYTPPEAESVDVFRLLEQLEELPEKSRHLPFNIRVGFNEEQFYYLVLKIRANLPEEMKRAQKVARDTQRIVDEAKDSAAQQVESARVDAQQIIHEAQAEAQRIIQQAQMGAQQIEADARAQALEMVSESQIIHMATAQAHELIRSAETEGSEIRRGADDYARDVLNNLETVMGKAIVTVRRGREALEAPTE